VRADFSASGKINNFDDIIINRVRPIPGIVGYDRDTVIDLRTGARLTTQLASFEPNSGNSERDKTAAGAE
jgi:hypothetical protein